MGTVKLLLAGDVMTGRGIDQVLAHPSPPPLFEAHVRDARDYVRLAERVSGPIPAPVAPDYLWGDALAVVKDAACDLRIANLETAVTTSQRPWPGKGIHYRMHPANVACLSALRLDACTLANNHVLDWSRAGLRETLATLAGAGVRTAGAGLDEASATAVLPLPLAAGGRVLLSAWAAPGCGVPEDWAAVRGRSGVALLKDLSERAVDRVGRAVAAVRAPGDRVVVSLHWGGNWGFAVPQAHRWFAHRLIDAGVADVVHGHSSHHPLPMEVHRGRAILYGCGDLINDYEGIGPFGGGLRSDLGCLYFLTLGSAGDLQRLEVVPMRMRRLRLERADATDFDWLQRLFDDEGRAFGSEVTREPGGRFLLRWR
jgi:poly-gamma-glutamate synthesis protein (capsule biosynthesis protein)